MSEKTFLAIDCGATSCRAVVGRFSSTGFEMREVYRFPNTIVEKDGKYYWDINEIYNHIVQCLCSLGNEKIHIDSIGIDSWGVDFGLLDGDGHLAGLPRAYRDPYTDGMPDQLFEKIPEQMLYAITGTQVMNFNSVFQIYAQSRQEPQLFDRAKQILFIPDLLSYMLTGKAVCEYTIASTSGMLDQNTHTFSSTILQHLGIDRGLFPEMVMPGTQTGTLCDTLAQQTKLGAVPVVAVAGHDTASAVAAVPSTERGFAYLSSGTWSLMGIETTAPIINKRSQEQNFTNEGGVDGTTRFLKNITGMWLIEQCRKKWAHEGIIYSYPEIVAMAKASTDYKGRIDPDAPRFANPADMEAEIAKALADNGCQAPSNHAETVACIYHSLADRYARVLSLLRQFAPFEIERLHIIGGGAANDLLNQWTANATGITVIAGPTEATAIGNLMVQARAAALVNSLAETRRMIASNIETKTFLPK